MNEEMRSITEKPTNPSNNRLQLNEVRRQMDIFHKLLIFLEMVSIFSFIGLNAAEINYSGLMYFNCGDIDSTNYYAVIKAYISSVEVMLKFNFTPDGNYSCSKTDFDGTFAFNQIMSFDGICGYKKSNSSSTKIIYGLDLSGKIADTSICEFRRLDLKKNIQISPNFEGKICFQKRSAIENKFVFSQNNCTNGVQCGGYGGYNMCVYNSDLKCPIFYFSTNESLLKQENVIYEQFIGEGYMDSSPIFAGRSVSESYKYAFFNIKFAYGNQGNSSNLTILKMPYRDFYKEKSVDFSFVNPNTQFKFFSFMDYFYNGMNSSAIIKSNMLIIQKNNSLDTNALYVIDKYPSYNFSLASKYPSLPNKNCLHYFADQSYFDVISKLFIERLYTSLPTYLSYVILEIVFILIFKGYIKGYINYTVLRGHKVNHHDKLSEAVTNNTTTIFHLLIILLKIMMLLSSLNRIIKKKSMINYFISNKCYDDTSFMNSLFLLGQDLDLIEDKIYTCLYINAGLGSTIIVNCLIFIYYYYRLHRKYEELKSKIKNK